MNRALASLMLASAGALIGIGCASGQTSCPTAGTCCGACVVPAGDSTTLSGKSADALRETLQDERRSRAFYTAVLAKHGQIRPFSMIVHAEERHEAVITALMSRHGVAIPGGPPPNLPDVPGTAAECSRMAAQLERENIAMYDRLLPDVDASDIRTVFENLRAASKNNHLPAFERWSVSAGSAATGRAMALGYGGRAGRGGWGGCAGPRTLAP